jgi:hypothetical protein
MVMVSAGLLPMLVVIVALANKLRGSPGRSLHVTAQYVTVEAADTIDCLQGHCCTRSQDEAGCRRPHRLAFALHWPFHWHVPGHGQLVDFIATDILRVQDGRGLCVIAEAASGRAAARAPRQATSPSSVMKSRRFNLSSCIRSPRQAGAELENTAAHSLNE